MIIIYKDNGGRLCNKLHLFAHFIAFSIEHRVVVAYRDFDFIGQLFEATKGGRSIFLPADQWLTKWAYPCLVRHLIKTKDKGKIYPLTIEVYANLKADFVDLADRDKVRMFLSAPFIFTNGYFFRYYEGVKRYSDRIRKFFRPLNGYCLRAEEYMRQINRDKYLVIGVHIRHTDYQTFQGGRHFFTISQYKGVMESVKRTFKDEREPFFVVSSDTELSVEDFKGFKVLIINDEAIVCLQVLSMCDYIIGPKSSFNRWASFYGSVPLYTIYDAERSVSKEDFRVNYLDDSHAIFNEPD